MNPWVDPDDFDSLVQQLADPVRSKRAFRHLIAGGAPAIRAVRRGLTDPVGDVRMHCARALDHLVDEGSWPALISMLEDRDPRVRAQTLHALACDRCKQGSGRPERAEVLAPAIAILRSDPWYHVRAMAVEVVAYYVHEDPDAAATLEAARDGDPSPMVRKKARWFAPGGVRYEKTAPRQARRARSHPR